LAALGASGCSADIARFDFQSNLSDTSTGAIPVPSEDVGAGRSNLGNGSEAGAAAGEDTSASAPQSSYAAAPSAASSSKIDVSALPPPVSPVTPSSASPNPRPYAEPPQVTAEAVAAEERGEQIEVRPGDTLYGLSKRHQVSLNELMRVNGLTSPALKPGQKLSLPSGKAVARAPKTETATLAPVAAPTDWSGSYTVKPGDSLYAIARQQKVKFTDLQRYNGIADVRKVKPGTVLKVPGIGGAVLAEAATTSPPSSAPLAQPATPAGAPITETPVANASAATPSATPTILNSQRPAEQKVAELQTETKSDAIPVPGSGSVASTGKLRWPVKGRVIAGFGPRNDGTHNDGINIAVPQGTDVHAAENGTIAYAGNELKGYGNLILVRHDNGWVTAYAHAEELLVKRGDKVSRGQVIAKAGKTGQVDQPQLHFEVRQGQKPVDPRPHLDTN
jgi:murein DD-endopeptidase MepM/ murein hydrolase activator NlpD